jgi:hypothetical protein
MLALAVVLACIAADDAAWDVNKELQTQRLRGHQAEVDSAVASLKALDDGNEHVRFFLYPSIFKEDGFLSYWFSNLTEALANSPRRTKDPREASLFFLGIDTACERNWPNYLGESTENYVYGDTDTCSSTRDKRIKAYLTKHAVHLKLDSMGDQARQPGYKGNGTHMIINMNSYNIIPSYIQSNRQQIRFAVPSQDVDVMGSSEIVSWPAKNLVDFTADSPGYSLTCDASYRAPKYLLVFKGSPSYPTRKKLGTIDNGKDIRIVIPESREHCSGCGGGEYRELLMNSTFGAVVRGDTFYSYRFLEVMSAGIVPVIYSDKVCVPQRTAIGFQVYRRRGCVCSVSFSR